MKKRYVFKNLMLVVILMVIDFLYALLIVSVVNLCFRLVIPVYGFWAIVGAFEGCQIYLLIGRNYARDKRNQQKRNGGSDHSGH